jgi:predicted phosphodiesterase
MAERLYQERKRCLPYIFAFLGAVIVLNLVGSAVFRIDPLEVTVEIDIGFPGYTLVRVPPIGSIRARTHNYQPLQLVLTLTNIDLDSLRSAAFSTDLGTQAALVEYFSSKINQVIGAAILKMMLIAGSGGLLGVFLFGQRRLIDLLTGFAIGSVLILAILTSVYFSYDIQAFANPQYMGIIEAAPWMLGLIQEGLVKVDELGEQIQSLAANLYTVFNQIENLQDVSLIQTDLTVLHVSDIHNHPAAFDFMAQVVSAFPVDLIIDTGDLTDWGTPLEAEIIERIEKLDVSYLFVSGNHEAPDVISRLKDTENVILLGPDPIEVMGLTIAGYPDPAVQDYSPRGASLAELNEIASRINEQFSGLDHKIDIFAVHNHRIAGQIEPGVFPVVVFGHNHQQLLQQVDNTIYINAGTTGAAGIRGIQSSQAVPFSLALLYFTYDQELERHVLAAVDSIQVQSLQQSFSLERTFITYPGRNRQENVENDSEESD